MRKSVVIGVVSVVVALVVGVFVLQKKSVVQVVVPVGTSTATVVNATSTLSIDWTKVGKDRLYTEEEGKFDNLNQDEQEALEWLVAPYTKVYIDKYWRVLAIKNGYAMICEPIGNKLGDCRLYYVTNRTEVPSAIFTSYTENGLGQSFAVEGQVVVTVTDDGIFYYKPGMSEFGLITGSGIAYAESYFFYDESTPQRTVSLSLKDTILTLSIFPRDFWVNDNEKPVALRQKQFLLSGEYISTSDAVLPISDIAQHTPPQETRIYDSPRGRYENLNEQEKIIVDTISKFYNKKYKTKFLTQEKDESDESPQRLVDLVALQGDFAFVRFWHTTDIANDGPRYMLFNLKKNKEILFPLSRDGEHEAYQLTDNIFIFIQDSGIAYYSPGMSSYGVVENSSLPSSLSYTYKDGNIQGFTQFENQSLILPLYERGAVWDWPKDKPLPVGQREYQIPIEPVARPKVNHNYPTFTGKNRIYSEDEGLFANVSSQERDAILQATSIPTCVLSGLKCNYSPYIIVGNLGLRIVSFYNGYLLLSLPNGKGGISYRLYDLNKNIHSQNYDSIYGPGIRNDKIIFLEGGKTGLVYYRPGMDGFKDVFEMHILEYGELLTEGDGLGAHIVGKIIDDKLILPIYKYDPETEKTSKVREITVDLSSLP